MKKSKKFLKTKTQIPDHVTDRVVKKFQSATGKGGGNLRDISYAAQGRVARSMPEDVAQHYNMDNKFHLRPLDEGEKPYFKYLYNHIHIAIKDKNEAEKNKDVKAAREAQVRLHGGLKEMKNHFGKTISDHVTRSKRVLFDLTSSDPKVKKQMTENFYDNVRASIKK